MKIGLCLGGGAVRGMGFIGMLEVLEEYGLHFDMVSGCSIGSIIGGCYAAGASVSQMKELMLSLKQRDVLDVRLSALKHNGLIKGNKITRLIRELTSDVTVEECPIPFISLATDVITGRPVYLDSGKLTDAIRPSFAMPGIISAVERDGMLLVDGALVERMPINILRERGMDKVLALNCWAELTPIKRPRNPIMHVARAFDILDWNSTKMRLNQADYVVSMDRGDDIVHYKISESRRAYEMGREAMLSHVDKVMEIFAR